MQLTVARQFHRSSMKEKRPRSLNPTMIESGVRKHIEDPTANYDALESRYAGANPVNGKSLCFALSLFSVRS